MTAITLTSVRDAVRQRGDLPLSRKFTNDFLDREIQASWTALHRLVERVNEGHFDRDATVATVANQAYVAPPVDARKIKGVDILDGGEYVELVQVGLGERSRFGQSADQPVAYRLTERGIDLYPTPNAVYTLRVTYARRVSPLSAVAVEVDEEWQDYVVWSSIMRVAPSEERPMNDYAAMVAAAEAAIKEGAGGRRQQEPEYLVLREYAPNWGGY